MTIAAQRLAFFLLCLVGISIPYLVIAIDFQTDGYQKLQSTVWAKNAIRFISVSDAIDEIWKIILPLATTLLASDYLRSKHTLEQVVIFFVFFLTYVVANYCAVSVQDQLMAARIKVVFSPEIAQNLGSVLLGVGQYCVTIAVLILGLKSAGSSTSEVNVSTKPSRTAGNNLDGGQVLEAVQTPKTTP